LRESYTYISQIKYDDTPLSPFCIVPAKRHETRHLAVIGYQLRARARDFNRTRVIWRTHRDRLSSTTHRRRGLELAAARSRAASAAEFARGIRSVSSGNSARGRAKIRDIGRDVGACRLSRVRFRLISKISRFRYPCPYYINHYSSRGTVRRDVVPRAIRTREALTALFSTLGARAGDCNG